MCGTVAPPKIIVAIATLSYFGTAPDPVPSGSYFFLQLKHFVEHPPFMSWPCYPQMHPLPLLLNLPMRRDHYSAPKENQGIQQAR
jgi:hypothetical protein